VRAWRAAEKSGLAASALFHSLVEPNAVQLVNVGTFKREACIKSSSMGS
jgi:hypothetical protein